MENFKINPSNEEIWRTSTNRIESLKSPSSQKNKQKTCNFTKKKSTNDDLKEQFFLKSKRKKNHKTIKDEWINGWNRSKKNHIDLSTISLLQNSSHLVPSSGCRKGENYLKRRSKIQEKWHKIHFENSSRRAKYWRIQERWKKKREKIPQSLSANKQLKAD